MLRRIFGLRQNKAFSKGLPQPLILSPQEICSVHDDSDLLGRCCIPQNAEARLAEVLPRGAMSRDLKFRLKSVIHFNQPIYTIISKKLLPVLHLRLLTVNEA